MHSVIPIQAIPASVDFASRMRRLRQLELVRKILASKETVWPEVNKIPLELTCASVYFPPLSGVLWGE